jgi:hypothetical protein
MISETTAAAIVIIFLLISGCGIWLVLLRRRLNPLAADASMGWPPYVEHDRWTRALGSVGAVFAVFLAAILAAAFVWYAVAPTWQQVYDTYAARIDGMQDRFRRIAGMLPEPGDIRDDRCTRSLDPVPAYDLPRRQINADFVHAAELRVQRHAGEIDGDLYLGGDLARLLYWRHTPPLTNDEKASRDTANAIEQTLSTRYLIVYRPVQDRDRDTPREIEAFLFDLPATEMVCAMRVPAAGTTAARELLYKLRELTGGVFVGR